MSSNKSIREVMEYTYGKGCMFIRADIAERIKQMGGIKTYKVFIQQKHYTGKKLRRLERNLTYHHLVHKSEGGKATIENGAVINELAHQYIHSLPREQEEVINDMLRDYKKEFELHFGIATFDGKTLNIDPYTITFDTNSKDVLTIPVYPNTKEDYEKRQKFNRAKQKQETRQLIDNILNEEGNCNER